jgi:pimeloyl-ACP methyl ester carboxylesterase
MKNRPQTLVGTADSPAALAAWIIDHDPKSYEMIARVFDGKTEGLSRDDILDNITLYWLTNTGVSSARLYWENTGPFFDADPIAAGIKVPTAVSVFPREIYVAPRSWGERAYKHLIYWHEVDKGTHFAAWEQPAIFTDEVRAAFKSLRRSSY